MASCIVVGTTVMRFPNAVVFVHVVTGEVRKLSADWQKVLNESGTALLKSKSWNCSNLSSYVKLGKDSVASSHDCLLVSFRNAFFIASFCLAW